MLPTWLVGTDIVLGDGVVDLGGFLSEPNGTNQAVDNNYVAVQEDKVIPVHLAFMPRGRFERLSRSNQGLMEDWVGR